MIWAGVERMCEKMLRRERMAAEADERSLRRAHGGVRVEDNAGVK